MPWASASRESKGFRAPRYPNAASLAHTPARWHRRHVAWVYILPCSDGSLYVGLTDDVEERVCTHNEGRGGSYTAKRRPVTLLFRESFAERSTARNREASGVNMDEPDWRLTNQENYLTGVQLFRRT
jgi:predicted GIY-YIG superfamily endonuclease